MIEVFKTNISTPTEAAAITQALLRVFPTFDIHFDLEDCDQILRIAGLREPMAEVVGVICEHIRQLGYHCEVLEG